MSKDKPGIPCHFCPGDGYQTLGVLEIHPSNEGHIVLREKFTGAYCSLSIVSSKRARAAMEEAEVSAIEIATGGGE